MTKLSNAKRISICAMCIALCYVLPLAFHAVGLGSVLSPMHIPVLLCGLVCGGGWGALCGLLGVLLSSLLSGMPGAMMLPRMIPELMTYGLAAGLCMRYIRAGHMAADVYISLAAAMVLGRVVGGIATMLWMAYTTSVYSVTMWVTGYFVEAVPGIIAHLVLVPLLVFTLVQVRLIPSRYPR